MGDFYDDEGMGMGMPPGMGGMPPGMPQRPPRAALVAEMQMTLGIAAVLTALLRVSPYAVHIAKVMFWRG
jgi:hypothetical protein